MKTLTHLAYLVDLYWGGRTTFQLNIRHMSGSVTAAVSNFEGSGPIVQAAIDDLCSAQNSKSILTALIKRQYEVIDRTSTRLQKLRVDLDALTKTSDDARRELARLQAPSFGEG